MHTRKVLPGWIIYVAGSITTYGLLFNGKFGQGEQLPLWLIGAASVMAIAAMVCGWLPETVDAWHAERPR